MVWDEVWKDTGWQHHGAFAAGLFSASSLSVCLSDTPFPGSVFVFPPASNSLQPFKEGG